MPPSQTEAAVGASPFQRLLHYSHLFASVVHGSLEERCLRQATPLPLTIQQVNLLRLIDHRGTHHVGDMADLLGVSQPAASKNVDKLVRLKLVNREVLETDRRALSLSLTEEGRALIRRYEQAKEAKLQQAVGELSPADLEQLTTALAHVSYQILKGENTRGNCNRCNAYYTEACPMRALAIGCSYLKTR
jgi:DNA-binding MarR family transcriptional regulator